MPSERGAMTEGRTVSAGLEGLKSGATGGTNA